MIVQAKHSVNKILVKQDIHKGTPGNPGALRNRTALLVLVLTFIIEPEE